VATTYIAWLSGGPCDGIQKKLTATQFDSGHTTCSGETYIKTGDKLPGENVWVFQYQAQASTGSAGGDTIAPHTHSGWRDLRNVTKHNVHASLKQSHAATSTALRDLAKLPKVRRG